MKNPNVAQAPTSEDLITIRDRIEAAQEKVAGLYSDTRKKVVAGAKYADKTVRARPYQSLAIAIGLGALLGLIFARRNR